MMILCVTLLSVRLLPFKFADSSKVALHINATGGGDIHMSGKFLPWHRLTVWTYENTLRTECGYSGTQPYWDYNLDSPDKGGHFTTSPLFDPQFGFGGNGKTTSGQDAKPGSCSSSTFCGSCE
jgi:tyrosinase